jgi:hypothetical protein
MFREGGESQAPQNKWGRASFLAVPYLGPRTLTQSQWTGSWWRRVCCHSGPEPWSLWWTGSPTSARWETGRRLSTRHTKNGAHKHTGRNTKGIRIPHFHVWTQTLRHLYSYFRDTYIVSYESVFRFIWPSVQWITWFPKHMLHVLVETFKMFAPHGREVSPWSAIKSQTYFWPRKLTETSVGCRRRQHQAWGGKLFCTLLCSSRRLEGGFHIGSVYKSSN